MKKSKSSIRTKGMKMEILKKSIVIASILFSSNVWSSSKGWIYNVEVFRVVVVVNGGVNVRVIPELKGCVSQSGYGETYASILPSHPGIDRIYSGLLAAQVSKQKVSIYLRDNVCTVGEVVIGGEF